MGNCRVGDRDRYEATNVRILVAYLLFFIDVHLPPRHTHLHVHCHDLIQSMALVHVPFISQVTIWVQEIS
jgi:hypothetical protein